MNSVLGPKPLQCNALAAWLEERSLQIFDKCVYVRARECVCVCARNVYPITEDCFYDNVLRGFSVRKITLIQKANRVVKNAMSPKCQGGNGN